LETAPDGPKRFAGYRDLLNLDIDIVSICLPTSMHHGVTLEALHAGKHVLLEKPISTKVADAQAMIEAAGRCGKQLFVGMTHRFYPEVREAKRMVEDGAIGEIVMMRDSILEHFGFLNSPSWYLNPEFSGGGTVLSSGIHLVDRVMWFAGESPVSVSGYAGSRFLGQGVEDAAQMSLSFRSGRFAQIVFGMLAKPHPLICDMEIIGTTGSIVIHTWRGYEYRSRHGTEYHEIYKSESHAEKVLVGMCAEVDELCSAIREGREARPTAEESTRALRVIEAFYRAVETRSVEHMEAPMREADGS
jgi:predicted dehydrogenase